MEIFKLIIIVLTSALSWVTWNKIADKIDDFLQKKLNEKGYLFLIFMVVIYWLINYWLIYWLLK